MECRLIPERHTEAAYDTFFAEVVSAQADARVFDAGRWSFDAGNAPLHTLHHLGGGSYGVIGDVVQGSVLQP
jgi:flavin reductase (DIM6/NTAB) family NADH-FMN oxidoreductase RutF